MVLKFWWMLLVWAGVAGICFVWWRIRKAQLQRGRQRKGANAQVSQPSDITIAHLERFTNLTSYSKFLRRYRLLAVLLVVCLAGAVVASFILTLRPASTDVIQPEQKNRDIMLCLDVSGSMVETDQQVMATFSKLAAGFDGQRLGLVVFDSSASTMFPLTDDYDFVKDRLNTLSEDLKSDNYLSDLYSGTYEGEGSSLIGDGLASCVMRFDNLASNRSRSIILVTDNYVAGAQIVDLKQAGAFAKDKSIRVYGINPDDTDDSWSSDEAKEFRQVVLATDGAYYRLNYETRGDAALVSQIVDAISKQEATRYKGAAQVVQTDIPLWFVVTLTVAVVGLFVINWRLLR